MNELNDMNIMNGMNGINDINYWVTQLTSQDYQELHYERHTPFNMQYECVTLIT